MDVTRVGVEHGSPARGWGAGEPDERLVMSMSLTAVSIRAGRHRFFKGRFPAASWESGAERTWVRWAKTTTLLA